VLGRRLSDFPLHVWSHWSNTSDIHVSGSLSSTSNPRLVSETVNRQAIYKVIGGSNLRISSSLSEIGSFSSVLPRSLFFPATGIAFTRLPGAIVVFLIFQLFSNNVLAQNETETLPTFGDTIQVLGAVSQPLSVFVEDSNLPRWKEQTRASKGKSDSINFFAG
jgi:hypothetical protein